MVWIWGKEIADKQIIEVSACIPFSKLKTFGFYFQVHGYRLHFLKRMKEMGTQSIIAFTVIWMLISGFSFVKGAPYMSPQCLFL